MKRKAAGKHQATAAADSTTQPTPTHPETAAGAPLQFQPGASLLVPGFEIGACLMASDGIGGDFFDIIELSDQRVGIAVGDASGRGTASERLMAKAQGSLRAEATSGGEAVTFISRLNEGLRRDGRPQDSVTLFYGVVSDTNQLRYVSAGHPPAMLVRNDRSLPLAATGCPLGLFVDATWGEARVPLEPGDVLLVYSDGVTDAQSPAGPFFDEGGIESVLRDHRSKPAHEIAHVVCDAAERFERGSPDPTDDKTVVVVRVRERPDAG